MSPLREPSGWVLIEDRGAARKYLSRQYPEITRGRVRFRGCATSVSYWGEIDRNAYGYRPAQEHWMDFPSRTVVIREVPSHLAPYEYAHPHDPPARDLREVEAAA